MSFSRETFTNTCVFFNHQIFEIKWISVIGDTYTTVVDLIGVVRERVSVYLTVKARFLFFCKTAFTSIYFNLRHAKIEGFFFFFFNRSLVGVLQRNFLK